MNTTLILKKTTWLVVCLTALLVAGCTNGELTLTKAETAKAQANIIKKGEARKELFTECMELAAKMPRQADDDVSDIVDSCSASSYYMTNYMK